MTALERLWLADNDFCVSTNMKKFWKGRDNNDASQYYGTCAPTTKRPTTQSPTPSPTQPTEDFNDIKPPNWWKNPTCVLQDSSGNCGIRVKRDSIYCRKTCGLCGDREPATLHPTSSPTNVPTPACHDVNPPPWWKNNSCSLQLSSGKCQKRMERNSKYCRKTCEICT